MMLDMLKGKIHRATVVQAELNYVGSITVDLDLLEAGFIDSLSAISLILEIEDLLGRDPITVDIDSIMTHRGNLYLAKYDFGGFQDGTVYRLIWNPEKDWFGFEQVDPSEARS